MLKIARRKWKLIAGTIVISLTLAILGLGTIIGGQVNDAVAAAQATHPGDPVAALQAVVTDPVSSLAQKNQAVWALGQLGDSRALELLKSQLTGQDCDHSRQICQRELKKAIDGCAGGCNLGAIVWRHGELTSK